MIFNYHSYYQSATTLHSLTAHACTNVRHDDKLSYLSSVGYYLKLVGQTYVKCLTDVRLRMPSVCFDIKLSMNATDIRNEDSLHFAGLGLASSTWCRTNHNISLLDRPRRKNKTRLVPSITSTFSRTMLAADILVREDSKLLSCKHATDERNVRNDAKPSIRTHAPHH